MHSSPSHLSRACAACRFRAPLGLHAHEHMRSTTCGYEETLVCSPRTHRAHCIRTCHITTIHHQISVLGPGSAFIASHPRLHQHAHLVAFIVTSNSYAQFFVTQLRSVSKVSLCVCNALGRTIHALSHRLLLLYPCHARDFRLILTSFLNFLRRSRQNSETANTFHAFFLELRQDNANTASPTFCRRFLLKS